MILSYYATFTISEDGDMCTISIPDFGETVDVPYVSDDDIKRKARDQLGIAYWERVTDGGKPAPEPTQYKEKLTGRKRVMRIDCDYDEFLSRLKVKVFQL